MISKMALLPGWTIARSMWAANRAGFLALFAGVLAFGWGFHLVPISWQRDEGTDLLAYLPMGLSIFLTFVLCNFTESDRKGRFDGFPARLFTLPVSTMSLLMAPMLFSVAIVAAVYAAWTTFALPALGRDLPLGWPLLYLASGMICYQAIVWSLARFRMMRMIVLGIGGTFLALGWLVLRKGVERYFLIGLIPENLPVRPIAFAFLGLLSLLAFVIANIAVENQRRGGMREWKSWVWNYPERSTSKPNRGISFLERLADLLPRRKSPFKRAADAQFWFEWRRHGSLLPQATGAVLFLIVAPAPFLAPIGAERVGILLSWILTLPLLLAFVLGKGFGKADLWSKEPGIPVFLATKPLSIDHWIGAKIKAGALATASAWLVVFIVTPIWLGLWCDYRPLLEEIHQTATGYPAFALSTGIAVLVLCMLLTWRFLVGSLYLGLSGKAWLLNTGACGVFLTIFAVPLGLSVIFEHHSYLLLYPPGWLPWLIATLLVIKISGAAWLARSAYSSKLITTRTILNYLGAWLVGAITLIAIGFKLLPFEITRAAGWSRWTVAMLILFIAPLFRVAAAPLVLARNRQR